MDFFVATPDPMGVVVKDKISDLEPARLRRDDCSGAAQRDVHTCDEFFECEWLDYVVIAARSESPDSVGRGVASREEQYGCLTSLGAEYLEYFKAVVVGEHHVEHDRVGSE